MGSSSDASSSAVLPHHPPAAKDPKVAVAFAPMAASPADAEELGARSSTPCAPMTPPPTSAPQARASCGASGGALSTGGLSTGLSTGQRSSGQSGSPQQMATKDLISDPEVKETMEAAREASRAASEAAHRQLDALEAEADAALIVALGKEATRLAGAVWSFKAGGRPHGAASRTPKDDGGA